MDDVCGSEEWIILSLIIKYKTKYSSQGARGDWLRKTEKPSPMGNAYMPPLHPRVRRAGP
jgi:hypothetical protein